MTLGAEVAREKFGCVDTPNMAPVNPASFNIFSKKRWTHTRGVSFAVGAGVGFALSMGGIYLLDKYFWRQPKRDAGRGKRLHARSWNISDIDTASWMQM